MKGTVSWVLGCRREKKLSKAHCGLRVQLEGGWPTEQDSPGRSSPPNAPASGLLRALRSRRKQQHPVSPPFYARPSRPHRSTTDNEAPGDAQRSKAPRHCLHAETSQPLRRIRAREVPEDARTGPCGRFLCTFDPPGLQVENFPSSRRWSKVDKFSPQVVPN